MNSIKYFHEDKMFSCYKINLQIQKQSKLNFGHYFIFIFELIIVVTFVVTLQRINVVWLSPLMRQDDRKDIVCNNNSSKIIFGGFVHLIRMNVHI